MKLIEIYIFYIILQNATTKILKSKNHERGLLLTVEEEVLLSNFKMLTINYKKNRCDDYEQLPDSQKNFQKNLCKIFFQFLVKNKMGFELETLSFGSAVYKERVNIILNDIIDKIKKKFKEDKKTNLTKLEDIENQGVGVNRGNIGNDILRQRNGDNFGNELNIQNEENRIIRNRSDESVENEVDPNILKYKSRIKKIEFLTKKINYYRETYIALIQNLTFFNKKINSNLEIGHRKINPKEKNNFDNQFINSGIFVRIGVIDLDVEPQPPIFNFTRKVSEMEEKMENYIKIGKKYLEQRELNRIRNIEDQEEIILRSKNIEKSNFLIRTLSEVEYKKIIELADLSQNNLNRFYNIMIENVGDIENENYPHTSSLRVEGVPFVCWFGESRDHIEDNGYFINPEYNFQIEFNYVEEFFENFQNKYDVNTNLFFFMQYYQLAKQGPILEDTEEYMNLNE